MMPLLWAVETTAAVLGRLAAALPLGAASSSKASDAPAASQSYLERIIAYYEESEDDYSLLWDLDASLAMHIGYWDSRTWTLRQALRRQNEVLAELAAIRRGEYVLDAGCGVGGSAIFLARNYGCAVHGISLSEKQVQRARANASRRAPDAWLRFDAMDYCHTSFDDGQFDVVWALESSCYAKDKGDLAREAYRVLEPGGRLVLADGFLTRPHYDDDEQDMLDGWLKNWAVDSLVTRDDMAKKLEQAGFRDANWVDITRYVVPSARLLYALSLSGLPLARLGQALGCRSEWQQRNAAGAYYQYHVCRADLARYWMVCAYKPERTARPASKRRSAQSRDRTRRRRSLVSI